MAESFGGETITVVNYTEGAKDRYGIPARVPSPTTFGGCRFRPLSVTETVALTDTAIEIWKLTAPPVAALLNAEADSVIQVNGVSYEIDGGIKPYSDASGAVFKVTVLCKRQQKDIA